MAHDFHSSNYWDRAASQRRHREEVIQAFGASKVAFLERNIPHLAARSTLEVGCGDGFFSTGLMEKVRPVGTDLSEAMLARNPLSRKLVASAYRLPFPDDAFDVVVESNLLHHLLEPVAAVREMRRVSREFVALFEPNARSWPIMITHLIRASERGALVFCREHLEVIMRQAGVRELRSEDAGWITAARTPACLLPLLKAMERRDGGRFFCMCVGRVA